MILSIMKSFAVDKVTIRFYDFTSFGYLFPK